MTFLSVGIFFSLAVVALAGLLYLPRRPQAQKKSIRVDQQSFDTTRYLTYSYVSQIQSIGYSIERLLVKSLPKLNNCRLHLKNYPDATEDLENMIEAMTNDWRAIQRFYGANLPKSLKATQLNDPQIGKQEKQEHLIVLFLLGSMGSQVIYQSITQNIMHLKQLPSLVWLLRHSKHIYCSTINTDSSYSKRLITDTKKPGGWLNNHQYHLDLASHLLFTQKFNANIFDLNGEASDDASREQEILENILKEQINLAKTYNEVINEATKIMSESLKKLEEAVNTLRNFDKFSDEQQQNYHHSIQLITSVYQALNQENIDADGLITHRARDSIESLQNIVLALAPPPSETLDPLEDGISEDWQEHLAKEKRQQDIISSIVPGSGNVSTPS